MVPDSFKPGMMIYVNMHALDFIGKLEHIGDGKFVSDKGVEDLNNLNWNEMSYSFSEDQAKCKSYLYKLNQLQKQLDEETKQALKTKLHLDALNKKFGYLMEKYPEEFI